MVRDMSGRGLRMSEDDLRRLIDGRQPRKNNKFNAEITEVDCIKFRSKKEATFYRSLKILQAKGHVKYFHRQVAFDLPGNTKYYVDFQVFNKDGTTTYFDVKGRRLKEYIRNKKQVEALYPVEIIET
jgi:hypothetical protein